MAGEDFIKNPLGDVYFAHDWAKSGSMRQIFVVRYGENRTIARHCLLGKTCPPGLPTSAPQEAATQTQKTCLKEA